MNKRILISMVFAGVLFAGAAIAGPQHGGDRGPRHGGPEMAPQFIEHITRALRALDLTDEQRDGIRSELQGLKESMTPLVQSMHASRKDLRALVTADAFDSEAVKAEAEKQGAITAEMTILASNTIAHVLAGLDEEQRAHLKNMAEERQEFRGNHREWMKARKGRHHDRQAAPPPGD